MRKQSEARPLHPPSSLPLARSPSVPVQPGRGPVAHHALSVVLEQVVRFAQIVDTALFKAYLVARPGLIGSLCSLPNWCEVTEVQEVLMEREVGDYLIKLLLIFLPCIIEILRVDFIIQGEEDA